MVGVIGISEGTLEVNDEVVAYLSNSLSFNRGGGEVSVIAQTVGGGGIEAVTTTDAETRLGMVKFSMRSTAKSDQLLTSWQNKVSKNVVRISDQATGVAYVLTGASVVNNPDLETGADGAVEIEFTGVPEGL
ncbi:MAG: hypothetical protein V3U60_16290 [Gammaproteobacteria bacterium]